MNKWLRRYSMIDTHTHTQNEAREKRNTIQPVHFISCSLLFNHCAFIMNQVNVYVFIF